MTDISPVDGPEGGPSSCQAVIGSEPVTVDDSDSDEPEAGPSKGSGHSGMGCLSMSLRVCRARGHASLYRGGSLTTLLAMLTLKCLCKLVFLLDFHFVHELGIYLRIEVYQRILA